MIMIIHCLNWILTGLSWQTWQIRLRSYLWALKEFPGVATRHGAQPLPPAPPHTRAVGRTCPPTALCSQSGYEVTYVKLISGGDACARLLAHVPNFRPSLSLLFHLFLPWVKGTNIQPGNFAPAAAAQSTHSCHSPVSGLQPHHPAVLDQETHRCAGLPPAPCLPAQPYSTAGCNSPDLALIQWRDLMLGLVTAQIGAHCTH